jgi:hypothetical protein
VFGRVVEATAAVDVDKVKVIGLDCESVAGFGGSVLGDAVEGPAEPGVDGVEGVDGVVM